MASRRLDISSLLCDNDDDNNKNSSHRSQQYLPSSPVSDPIILAPHHLRSQHPQRALQDPSPHSLPPRRSPSPPTPSYPHRRQFPNAPPERDRELQSGFHSRTRSNEQSTISPSLSPSTHPQANFSGSPQLRGPVSPFPLSHSPISHRPASSHSVASTSHPQPPPRVVNFPYQPTSPSVQYAPLLSSPRPQGHHPSSPSTSNKLPYGLEALVHAATVERRRLSGGSVTEELAKREGPIEMPRPIALPSPASRRQLFEHHYEEPSGQLMVVTSSPQLELNPRPQTQRIPSQERRSEEHPSQNEHLYNSPPLHLPTFRPEYRQDARVDEGHAPRQIPSRENVEREQRRHQEQLLLQEQRQHEAFLLQEQHQQRLRQEQIRQREHLHHEQRQHREHQDIRLFRGLAFPLESLEQHSTNEKHFPQEQPQRREYTSPKDDPHTRQPLDHVSSPTDLRHPFGSPFTYRPSLASISPEIVPGSMERHQSAGRKSDPGEVRLAPTLPGTTSQSAQLILPEEPPPKKRRHSDTLSQPPPPTELEQERIHRDRERMAVSGLGHGRNTESAHRVSLSGRRDPDHKGLQNNNISEKGVQPTVALNTDGLEARRGPEASRVLSPIGRRSPPGSQAGRAKAAKKYEDVDSKRTDQTATKHPPFVDETKKVKDDAKSTHPRVLNISSPSVPPSTSPVIPRISEEMAFPHTSGATKPLEEKLSAPRASILRTLDDELPPHSSSVKALGSTRPTTDNQKEDAHEWFLEHYASTLSPAPHHRIPPVGTTTPSSSLQTKFNDEKDAQTISAEPPPVVPLGLTPTPSTMPEAATALEEELEELISGPTGSADMAGEERIDMDVDLEVASLVETLIEPEKPIKGESGLEVDVDEELLSLVDDRPTPPGRHPSSETPQFPSKPVRLEQEGEVKVEPLPTAASISAKNSGALSRKSGISPTAPSVLEGVSTPITSAARKATTREHSTDELEASQQKQEHATPEVTQPLPSARKKKDVANKPVTKSKAIAGASKPRVKAAPKMKPRAAASGSTTSKSVAGKAVANGTKAITTASSRSRSTSVIPGGAVVPEVEPILPKPEDEEPPVDDKLYCVCQTKYDEDRFMIACDRCDDWYHTQCVDMPDLEVDLVDQFICPPCIEKHPHLSLRTTYKQRCLYGLKHSDPDSSKACRKPARGAFSKFCSDECGVKYMQSRVDSWAKQGGKKDKLWESVKGAEKREGVVICAEGENENRADLLLARMEIDQDCKTESKVPVEASKIQREVKRLNTLLSRVVKLREEIKKGMEVVVWRERLLELAADRAERVGLCGWDQRLCFGNDEWAGFGAEVLETYEERQPEDGNGMEVDGKVEEEEAWWCPGEQMCDRHAGWQNVRRKDISKEKEIKEEALLQLTTREREVRKRIEDITDPHSTACAETTTVSPLKPTKLANGHARGKNNGESVKKGKKRKAPG